MECAKSVETARKRSDGGMGKQASLDGNTDML